MELTAKELNKMIEQIRETGQVPVTETSGAQQGFSRIIVPPDLAKEGNIMTYEEIIEYRKKYDKKLDKVEYTEDMYKEDLKNLYDTYKHRLNPEGERTYQWETMEKTINAFLPDVDPTKYSLEQLKEAFSQAHEMEREQSRKGKKVDSETFWKEVRKWIEEIGEDEE